MEPAGIDDPREHLALALDVGDLDAALAIARRVQPWFGVAKVGVELYAEAGPVAFQALRDKGFRVFADLKLHDIPTTVGRAARVLGRHGVDFLNFHAAGGEAMLRAGVEGLADGARDGGHARPLALAVTVLTSDPDVDAMDARLDVARDAGCDGVVCAGTDVERARARARCARWCPASVLPVTTPTTRRASTRPAMRSRAVPTGW